MRYLPLAVCALVLVLWIWSGASCHYYECMGVRGHFTLGAKHACFWSTLR